MKHDASEEVRWTSQMPDRRQNERRTLQERRNMSGHDRRLNVPNVRTGQDRRKGDRRKKINLVITGRAVDTSEEKSR